MSRHLTEGQKFLNTFHFGHGVRFEKACFLLNVSCMHACFEVLYVHFVAMYYNIIIIIKIIVITIITMARHILDIPPGYPLASDCSCPLVTGSSEVRNQSPGNHYHFCHYPLPLVDQLAHRLQDIYVKSPNLIIIIKTTISWYAAPLNLASHHTPNYQGHIKNQRKKSL